MEVEQGTWVRRGSGIVSLRPLMQSWLERSLEYCKCHGGEDNGWWYNERASLSILAGAAWSLERWCALEEYSTTKQGVVPAGEKDSGEVRSGRCDLWIGNSRTGYAIEAKQAWQSIGPGASGKNPNIWQQFEQAWRDAGALTCDEASKRIAVVFASPYIPAAKVSTEGGTKPVIDARKARQLTVEWLKAFDPRKNPRVTGFAWFFPKKSELFVTGDGKHIFPGTILLLGERKRANRRVRK